MGLKAMNWRARIALILMLIEAIGSMIMGFSYILKPSLTPYHESIMGQKYEDLAPGVQKIITILKGGTGHGGIQNGLILMLLLFVPFWRKHSWTRWGIPLADLIHRLPFLTVALISAISTGASTPWQIQVYGIVASILFFILTSKYLAK